MADRVADHVQYRRLISVAPDSSVEAVCRLMTERGIGAVAVVEDCGVLAGLVSEQDIVSQVVAKGRRPGITQVQEIMRRKPCTIDAEQPLSTAFCVLRDADLRYLPVMRNGRPISMLSMRDVSNNHRAARSAEVFAAAE